MAAWITLCMVIVQFTLDRKNTIIYTYFAAKFGFGGLELADLLEV